MNPNIHADRRVLRGGREVQISDFGGSGPLVLLLHGAGCDLTWWETLVPHLAGFHVVAQDLPGHGRAPLEVFTISEALADSDAVTAELGQGPPIMVGHSLGGYVGLRYAATRRCSAWIGLDGPFAVVYPWEQDDPGLPEFVLQIGREIRAINVVGDFAAITCPAMLILCSVAAHPMEECLLPARRAIAEHLARRHSEVRIEWVRTGHDALLSHNIEETAARIRDFLQPLVTPYDAEPNAAPNGGPAVSVDNSNVRGGPPSVS
jgi:pimeloyl-ACP methyl ester carboxylesterase